MKRLIAKCATLFVIFLFSNFFFATIGHILFKRINKESFYSIVDSIWTIFYMISITNFPDEYLRVAHQPYAWIYGLYFIIFILFNTIYIINFMVAILFVEY